MAENKFKTHCSIFNYIEQVDSELAAVITNLCAIGALTSLKGKPGITFLRPAKGKFRDELFRLAYHSNVDEAMKASDMLNALIIRDVFKTASEWKSRPVINSLFPYQIVEVASTTPTEVTFKSGAKATIDGNFVDASKKMVDGTPKQVLAVWNLTGEIPIDGPVAGPKSKEKKGSYEVNNYQAQAQRFKIALAVENAYAVSQSQQSRGRKNVYLDYTMSLVNHIMNIRKDTALMYEKVLPLLSFDKIDFYVLVEPHRADGNFLLDDNLIAEWWDRQAPCSPAAVMEDVQKLLKNGSGCAIYTNRSGVIDAIDSVRRKLMKTVEGKPRMCVDAISDVYDAAIANNCIGDVSGVWPQAIVSLYQSEPGLKMIHDELRYLCFGAFKALECAREFDYGRFHELTNMIGECLHAGSQVSRNASQKLLNKNKIKYSIAPTATMNEIKVFLYSTMFMYVPLTAEDANNYSKKYSVSRPDPYNIVVFNIAKDLYAQHERCALAPNANKDLIDAVMSLDISKLDAGLAEQLRKKFNL